METQEQRNNKCEARIDSHLAGLRDDAQAFRESPELETDELGHAYEYGLGADVADYRDGQDDERDDVFYRVQFSWGGPSDELRIFQDGRMEYWFLDWFDGAHRDVTGDELLEWFVEILTGRTVEELAQEATTHYHEEVV